MNASGHTASENRSRAPKRPVSFQGFLVSLSLNDLYFTLFGRDRVGDNVIGKWIDDLVEQLRSQAHLYTFPKTVIDIRDGELTPLTTLINHGPKQYGKLNGRIPQREIIPIHNEPIVWCDEYITFMQIPVDWIARRIMKCRCGICRRKQAFCLIPHPFKQ